MLYIKINLLLPSMDKDKTGRSVMTVINDLRFGLNYFLISEFFGFWKQDVKLSD